MIRSRFSLLGVLLAAIGLMAIFASAAQAEVGAKWLVLKEAGVLLTHTQILEKLTKFEIVELENKTGTLLSEIGTTKIEILCSSLELIDALLSETGVLPGATVKFFKCKFYSLDALGKLVEQPKCEPKTNKGALGTVETLPAHALLLLHELKPSGEKDDTLLILPDNAKVEATVLELGASCAFGEELPIFGHLALWDCGGNKKGLEHLLSHLVTEFEPLTTLALFAPRGKAGAKNAKLDGSATVKLNTDELWSGDPA